jgi:hypothetical protein
MKQQTKTAQQTVHKIVMKKQRITRSTGIFFFFKILNNGCCGFSMKKSKPMPAGIRECPTCTVRTVQ